jgi:plasmid stabilization system protein ParE
MRVRYLSGARRELIEAEQRYENIEKGLGASFYGEIKASILEISRHPFRFPRCDQSVRRCVINKRFPYAIFFEPRSDEIVIAAIMHTSRRPGYWQKRVIQG